MQVTSGCKQKIKFSERVPIDLYWFDVQLNPSHVQKASVQLRRVLVVDDHDPDLRYADIILKSANIARDIVLLHTARDALDYMQSVDAVDVDAILMDINMPEMSGFEFLEIYQPLFNEGLVSAAVVMHTSSSAESDKLQASRYACVAGYLVKPLTRLLAQQLPEMILHSTNRSDSSGRKAH